MYIQFPMTTKVQKWGNSLAVRLPKRVTQILHLAEGDSVRLVEGENSVLIVPDRPAKKTHTTKDWRAFIIPTGKKKGSSRASEQVDEIVYGISR